MFNNYSFTPTKREDHVESDVAHPDRIDDILARIIRIETRQFRMMEHFGIDPVKKSVDI